MFNLEELRHFVAFSELKTLLKVSEEFHISPPTITRSMKNVEEEFGAELFERSSNRIVLTPVGEMAVKEARKILEAADGAIRSVRDYEKGLRTITVSSCAPAPLWSLLPRLSSLFPERSISSSVSKNDIVQKSLEEGDCDIAILPYIPAASFVETHPYMEEHLYVCVRKEHELAQKSSITLSELNGYNFLLRSELGFWDSICRENMPASKFFVQKDEYEFAELVRNSSLPCFVTDVVPEYSEPYPGRVSIPITDECVNVTFYLAVRRSPAAHHIPLAGLGIK